MAVLLISEPFDQINIPITEPAQIIKILGKVLPEEVIYFNGPDDFNAFLKDNHAAMQQYTTQRLNKLYKIPNYLIRRNKENILILEKNRHLLSEENVVVTLESMTKQHETTLKRYGGKIEKLEKENEKIKILLTRTITELNALRQLSNMR